LPTAKKTSFELAEFEAAVWGKMPGTVGLKFMTFYMKLPEAVVLVMCDPPMNEL